VTIFYARHSSGAPLNPGADCPEDACSGVAGASALRLHGAFQE